MLEGVEILDLTRLLPGAYCSLLLADLGANVLKVEAPGRGDYLRWVPPIATDGSGQSVLFNAINRNKRSLTLNLKADAGRELFLELATHADVVIDGNRPGVIDRLGLGWQTLRSRNERLVLCSISGYGQDGPFAQVAGHDINYMAVAGALNLNGASDGAPLPLSVQAADLAGGAMGPALAIASALFAVARGAEGQHLDLSILEGTLGWMAPVLAGARLSEEPPKRSMQRLTGRFPCYRVYGCADGYLSVGALEPKFWEGLCSALERPDLVPHQFAEGEAARPVIDDLEAVFRQRTRSEWGERLRGLDVCCEPLLGASEVLDHPQVVARGAIIETESGLEVRPQFCVSEDWRRLPPPRIGEHTDEVLTGLGLDREQRDSLRVRGVI